MDERIIPGGDVCCQALNPPGIRKSGESGWGGWSCEDSIVTHCGAWTSPIRNGRKWMCARKGCLADFGTGRGRRERATPPSTPNRVLLGELELERVVCRGPDRVHRLCLLCAPAIASGRPNTDEFRRHSPTSVAVDPCEHAHGAAIGPSGHRPCRNARHQTSPADTRVPVSARLQSRRNPMNSTNRGTGHGDRTAAIGVCSWSLQVTSIPELKGFMDRLGIDVVQIACGDPHHASWDEGDAMPAAAKAAGFRMTGAMLGFPGEDYTTPQTIEKTGGFGDPATRPERLDRFKWGLDRARRAGPVGHDAARRVHPRGRRPRPQGVPRHAGAGRRPGRGRRGSRSRSRRVRSRPPCSAGRSTT